MLNLSLNELRLTAKSRDIKVYKDMSKEKLLSALSESESVESEKNLDNARIKKIRIEWNDHKAHRKLKVLFSNEVRNWRRIENSIIDGN